MKIRFYFESAAFRIFILNGFIIRMFLNVTIFRGYFEPIKKKKNRNQTIKKNQKELFWNFLMNYFKIKVVDVFEVLCFK